MNTQNSNFFKQLGQDQLNNLTKEVKETVAMGININNKNVFGAVDYWKMQRNRRTRIVRRHLVA